MKEILIEITVKIMPTETIEILIETTMKKEMPKPKNQSSILTLKIALMSPSL